MLTCTEPTHHPACMLVCRDCWAQEASQRPTFSEIVPRLTALLDQASA